MLRQSFIKVFFIICAVTMAGLVFADLPAPLTPAPAAAPRLTGPKVFGVRPNAPFLFTVTATGERPMTFAAKDLPAGLKIDEKTGQITGKIDKRGTYLATVTASNAQGEASRTLRIVAGDRIGLTPALGWNSWNVWGPKVTAEKTRAAADAMVSSGLANHGFTYINLDDGWQGPRKMTGAVPGPLTGDPTKFPDMKALSDYIHGKGLKFGVYSVPMGKSYANLPGGSADTPKGTILCSMQDILQFLEWCVDYIKFDGNPPTELELGITSELARTCGRDMIFTVSCNSGCGLPRARYNAALTHSWRTGYDLSDVWTAILHNGFVGLKNNVNIPSPDAWAPFTGPGRFPDIDMLVIGKLGTESLHASMLSADEQYTHISQWSLLASPLLLGCDLTQLDPFTLGLVTNDDVLDVDQDPLGLQATRIGGEVWARELEDGSMAVGLFNLGEAKAQVTVRWADLHINGKQKVRDLWRQKDLGVFEDQFQAEVPKHGVTLVRIAPATPGAPAITVQPIDTYAVEGKPAHLSVEAKGEELKYQWTREGKAIPGATSATYSIPAATMMDNNMHYRCVVANGIGRVTSYEAVLTVTGGETYLSDMYWISATNGWGTIHKDQSVMGNPIRLGGKTHARGLGCHAISEIVYRLQGRYATFKSEVGLDQEEGGNGSVVFQVFLDGVKVHETPTIKGAKTELLNVDVRGKNELKLVITDAGDGTNSDHADWGSARLISLPINDRE